MGGFSIARATVLVALIAASVIGALAGDVPECDGEVYLSVTPAQPGCDDVVTLGATQVLWDWCWTADPPAFFAESPDFSYVLASIDLHDSMPGCLTVIIEIPFTRQVGPLPPGAYSLSVAHTSTSPRHGNSACAEWIPFDVRCCAAVPHEVGGLTAALASVEGGTRLRWDDAAGADDYVVFGADAPDDPFTRQVASATDGNLGLDLPIDILPRFFVVAGRNDCGVGARH